MSILDYIVKADIEKKSDIVIIIPTFCSAEITSRLIPVLREQTGIDFDILIVDNASEDYLSLKKNFPEINYVLSSENTGVCGAVSLGMELARQNGYEFFILSDNDSIILGNDSLSRMHQRLKENADIDVVLPKLIETDNSISTDKLSTRASVYHYFFARTSILDKITPVNPNYFLLIDDYALTLKAISCGKVLICGDVFYYHITFKPKYWQNFCMYLFMRNLLILVFLETDIKFRYRPKQFLHFIFKVVLCFLLSVRMRDFSYVKTAGFAVRDFLFRLENIDFSHIPANKYSVREISADEADNPRPNSNWANLFGNCYKIHSNYYDTDNYYKLEKQKLNQ
ncbi:glycosyltransferase [Patescibacteria group bacterium]|nr:glycosyltransferase [Patescibacteria group bacterium]